MKAKNKIRVLIACEMSGVTRDAFAARGFDSMSCDLLPSMRPGKHYQGDVFDIINEYWDCIISHPPCKFLALCQAWRKLPSKADCITYGLARDNNTWRMEQRENAVKFATKLWNAPAPFIALEQPKSILSTRMHPKTQTIHPWQFGHGETKTTWLWLRNLPPLKPTNIVDGREERVWKMPPSETRSIERSITYAGIAEAMATQWGDFLASHL